MNNGTAKFDGVLIATSTVADGNMGFRFGEKNEVISNRTRFLEKLNIPVNRYICMSCTNGNTITPIDWSSPGLGARTPEDMPEAEVLVTDKKGLALMLLTADCIPAVFFDRVRGVIALAHLNRHTVVYNLAQKIIGFLREHYDSDPKDLQIYFGPHIRKHSYRFPLPLTGELPPQLRPFSEERDGYLHIDLESAYLSELASSGITREQIELSAVDTAASEKYFSHFQSTHDPSFPEGRMATIAMLTTSGSQADNGA